MPYYVTISDVDLLIGAIQNERSEPPNMVERCNAAYPDRAPFHLEVWNQADLEAYDAAQAPGPTRESAARAAIVTAGADAVELEDATTLAVTVANIIRALGLDL